MTTAAVRSIESSNGQGPGLPHYFTLKESASITRSGQSTLRAAARSDTRGSGDDFSSPKLISALISSGAGSK